MQDQDDRLEQAAPATPSAGQLLRQQAEEITPENAAQAPENIATMSLDETQRLLHELRVHQIELELQNEELRRVQLELQASQAQYFDLYDLAPVGYVTLSEQGLIRQANLTAATLLGMPRGQLVKQRLSHFIVRDDVATYVRHREQLLETGEPRAWDLQMVNEDGILFWAQLQATVAQDGKTNEPVCYVVISDITDRKRAAEEASRMVTVVRDSNDAITIQNFGGQITAWNHGAELMYGYSEAEALQMNIGRLTAPGKVEEQNDFTRRLLAGEAITSLETQRVTKDGRILDVWMTVTKLVDEAGKPIGIASTERDISDRKRAAEEASRMVTVVRDSNDAITIQDFEGQITAWNHGAELMYGYNEVEALQMNIGRLMAPGKVAEQNDFTRRLLAGEAITSLETRRVTKDGRILDVWMTVTKLVDDAGKPIGIASTERDISDRKRAAEEVHKLNAELEQRVRDRTAQLESANKELESFSYSVSHDLRAPLRHVQGYVDMLAREVGGQLSDKGRRCMKTIEDASREMGVLIDDLLTFSRMGRAEMTETMVNLDVLVQDTLRDLQAATSARNMVWKIPPLPAVQADPAMLKLVLTNLFGNAVKFTGPRDPAEIEMGIAGTENGRVILFVRDNGVGFDPQYTHQLFGVFQRLHPADEFEGTGIGLAHVRRIIARQGGRTWAEGKLNEGATFYFTLKPSSSTNPTS